MGKAVKSTRHDGYIDAPVHVITSKTKNVLSVDGFVITTARFGILAGDTTDPDL